MKCRSILCAIAFAVGIGGCADPLEQTSPEDVKSQLQRGVSGEGHLIDSESVNNPTAAPAGSGSMQPPPQ